MIGIVNFILGDDSCKYELHQDFKISNPAVQYLINFNGSKLSI